MMNGKYWIGYMLVIALLISSFGVPALAFETIDDKTDNDSPGSCVQETAVLHKESDRNVTTDNSNKTVTIGHGVSHNAISSANDIEAVVKNLFGDIEISTHDYLYNFDNTADYIYTEFTNGGYAVFLKDTMELLEYSTQGKIDYPDSYGMKYYGGPARYYTKNEIGFENIQSGELLKMSNTEAKEYSEDLRKKLKVNAAKKDDCVYSQIEFSSIDQVIDNKARGANNSGEVPSEDDYPVIKDLYIGDGTYITNYIYFMLNPTHGDNTTGTCCAVAVQLLLSYHNYYSDRRIIDNVFLNGSNSVTEKHLNPNYCEDPMSMTSQTLGTRGSDEDGSDITNSYFAKVVSEIGSWATLPETKRGMKALLDERNIDYSVKKVGGYSILNQLYVVNAEDVIAEIDEGRPVLVTMQAELGGSDHAVVAYGYQSYTYPDNQGTYVGYITHYGYGSNALNIWVNAAWCNGYISLEIDHVHDYDTLVGAIGNTGGVEYKCGECGHRTDSILNISVSNRYTERVVSIVPNYFKDYKISFATAGSKIIQTFGAGTGNHDGYIELYDDQGNLLEYDDDDGYEYNALLSYYFEADTEYTVRVSFFDPKEQSGDIKITIIPASGYDEYGEFYDLYDYTRGVTWSLSRYYVKLLTFEYSSPQDLTMRVTSDIDTVLYIVDPRSTELLTEALWATTRYYDNLYCDDYDDDTYDPKITKSFEANVPYLVIVSAYNPSSSTSVGDFYLNFE